MSDKNKFTFSDERVEVTWDKRLCIHVEECVRASGNLFVKGRKPWCQPGEAEIEEIVSVVKRCPTGALSYQLKDGANQETPDPENVVVVANDGPYFVRGDIELVNSPADLPANQQRLALCRCGASKNKPFCDNSHIAANFRDYGAVGDAGPGLEVKGGKLKITPKPGGSLRFEGNFVIKNGSGQIAWQGTQKGLCRCGASKNKPFCDGAHRDIGFTTE